MQVNPRRLYRSRDRQLAGVAGGMAEYLNIDPTISRILWILAAIFTGGLVILAYILLAIITPASPWAVAGPAPSGMGPAGAGPAGWAPPPSPAWGPASSQAPSQAWGPASSQAPSQAWSPAWTAAAAAEAPAGQGTRGRRFGAAAIVGVVLIVIGGIALADAALPGWSSAVILGPAIILALGAALLVASIRRSDEPAAAPATSATPPSEPAGSAAGDAPGTMPTATYQGTDTQPVDPVPLD
jgi:phage shock protein PspC (stress-responsive transcriptional regulator)